MQVHFAEQNFFFVVGSLGDYAAEGVAEERTSPKFQAFAGSGIAANIPGLEAHAVNYPDIYAIGNRVRALNGAPGIVLSLAKVGLLVRMPPDGGWVKKDARPLQRREPRAFRIPLIPAHERAKFSGGGIESLKAKIAGGEIKFFLVERIVGDVHLAVDATERAIRVEDGGSVVIEARGALLE